MARTLLHVGKRTSDDASWHVQFVPNGKRSLLMLGGLRGIDHDKLNLIGKAVKVHGQPVEQFALRRVRSTIAN